MKTYFVDSFTNEKFKGNPAAVCIVDDNLNIAAMQNIATEIGFSETAFIKKYQVTVIV
ncbi:MAG: PhzF family phenazine biosynthesis protein [Ferruginibacter sp.]